MMKMGQNNLTIGIIDYHLNKFEVLWQMYQENNKQIKKQKPRKDFKSDYYTNDKFDQLEEFFLDTRSSLMSRIV